jgi:mono/diheme cytochrome c family protein
MKKARWSLVCGLTLLFVFTFAGSSQQKQPEAWVVPEEYKKLENPVKEGEQAIEAGKKLYNRYCSFCHGRTGMGDGIKGKQLKTFPGDFSGDFYQSQTDGEHFYKTKFGRGEMPGYDGKIPDEDIWRMVIYMRTFRKTESQN